MRRESRRQHAENPNGHTAEIPNGHPAETTHTQDYGGRDVLCRGESNEVGVGDAGSPGAPASQPPGRFATEHRPAAPQT